MKVTAHVNGSYSLLMTSEELKAFGITGKKHLKSLAMGEDIANGHRVYYFYGSNSLELALEAGRFYGLLVER